MCAASSTCRTRPSSASPGRALTAHHAVLVTNLIGAEGVEVNDIHAPDEDAPTILQNMWKGWLDLRSEDPCLLEIFHDSVADLGMWTPSSPWVS